MGGSPARAITRIVKPPRPAPAPAPVMASPTRAEVSQATATSMDGYDSRKTKAKGRSMTIMTGPRGVEDETLTLGRKSLLGQ
tara:strand:+ start:239 stop:484 length:246 start_codon:yes stop_codon:yes gene_type:complete